jgi:hypothetical protein
LGCASCSTLSWPLLVQLFWTISCYRCPIVAHFFNISDSPFINIVNTPWSKCTKSVFYSLVCFSCVFRKWYQLGLDVFLQKSCISLSMGLCCNFLFCFLIMAGVL